MGLEGRDGLINPRPSQRASGSLCPGVLPGSLNQLTSHLHWSRMVMAEVTGIVSFQTLQVFAPEFK